MKLRKKLLSLLLALILAFTLVVPVAAVDTGPNYTPWRNYIEAFPTIYTGSDASLVGILQKFLYCYNANTRTLIRNAGGVDTAYGSGTINAVKAFQTATSISSDGICGTNTWKQIAIRLGVGDNTHNYLHGYVDIHSTTSPYSNTPVLRVTISPSSYRFMYFSDTDQMFAQNGYAVYLF